MRVASNLAALVALGTLGFAVGDWASHPNALGAVGLVVLLAAFTFLLSFLYRPARERVTAAPAPAQRPARGGIAPAAAGGWGAEEAQQARSRRRRPLRRDGRVDLNRATQQEIAALPGVGMLAAGRIIAERERGGPFSTVSDLARVPGFDPGKVRALADGARI